MGGGGEEGMIVLVVLHCTVQLIYIPLFWQNLAQLSCFERGDSMGGGCFFSCCACAIDLDFIVTEFG